MSSSPCPASDLGRQEHALGMAEQVLQGGMCPHPPSSSVVCDRNVVHLGRPYQDRRGIWNTTTEALPGSLPADGAPSEAAIAQRRMRYRVVLASILGNGLEWFDFVAYGYFASIVADVFFPAESNLSLLLTYASFAVGFVVRPIGGILIGAYADRYGRQRALSLLIVMMAFGTLTLGLTPGYASIG